MFQPLAFCRYRSPGDRLARFSVSLARPTNRALILAFILAFVPSFVLLLGMAMHKHLDHDEHQFVASGVLLARHGLLPYRDYPYFHVPNLVFVYAALDKFTSHLLTAARLFNVACGALTLSIIFVLGVKWFEPFGSMKDFAGAVAMLAAACNPAFPHTSGRAWNHDLPVLLTLIAMVSLWRWRVAEQRRARLAWAMACGALYGLAAGTRLTFLQCGAAFILAMCLATDLSKRRRLEGIAAFTLAAIIALRPSWWLLSIAPRQFIFGNFIYPGLNTAYRQAQHFEKSMSGLAKLRFVFTDVLDEPGNALLFLACIGGAVALWRRSGGERHRLRFEIISLALVGLSLLAGAFAATPLWLQYFFAPVPFAVLLVLAVAADTRLPVVPVRNCWKWLAGATAICCAFAIPPYWNGVTCLTSTSNWQPERVHAFGQELAARCDHGRVMTYAPIPALEGGCEIYTEFATGSFAARVAPLVNVADRQSLKEVDQQDLDQLLQQRPPAAVLVGLEEATLEEALVAFAQQEHYQRATVEDQLDLHGTRSLWLQPTPSIAGSPHRIAVGTAGSP
jgi:hypothetical protein